MRRRARVIVFGIQDFAELAWYYITKDTIDEVVAFTVHEKYIPVVPIFHGLPVVPFEKIGTVYPPEEFVLFAPMSPRSMNRVREGVYNEGKRRGYKFYSYLSSKATVFDISLGDNCFVLEDNTIQPFVSIGNNVVLWSGNHIGHHSRIEDHVTFTSHVVLSGHCSVEKFSFFGVNSTVRDGIRISEGTLVGMSACITKDTLEWSVYTGNPAKQLIGKRSESLI